ncbi:hypothetical protein [Achromobacter marplatensis]
MNWWKRWKKKHWDDQPYEGASSGGYIFRAGHDEAPLKQRVKAVWRDVVTHRWIVFGIAATIIAALLAGGQG